MKKVLFLYIIFISVLCINFAFGANVTHKYILDSQYSQSVILQANEQRTDTAISLPAKPSYDATTFNCGTNVGSDACISKANLNIRGANGAKYTLKINDKTTTFFSNSLILSQGANVALQGFHTISFETGGVNIGENSNLTIVNSGNQQINAQGSEYGGLTKVRFSPNVDFTLQAKSNVALSGIIFFISKGNVELNSNSNLNIQAPVIRFEKSFTNNGGTAILTTGLDDSKVKIGVYNVSHNSVATFTHKSGTTTINGHFYNGGQTVADGGLLSPQDPISKGGGNLIIEGGTMRVTGKLISQSSGLNTIQNSAISIYGATLIVGGGLENKQGSTITFGVLNGKMGEFQGTLKNEGGVVAVDRTGASLNTPYKIINGSANIDSVNLVGTNSQFFTATYNNGTVTITDGSGGGGGSGGGSSGGSSGGNVKFNEWQKTLSENEQGIVSVLSSKFGGDSKLLDSQVDVQTALADADKSVKDNLVSQPKNMLAAFKGDVLLAPMSQGRFVARRLAAVVLCALITAEE